MGVRRRRVHTEKLDAFWIEISHAERREWRRRRVEMFARLKKRKEEIMEEKRLRGQALERQAVTLYRQYGFILPGPAKEFFRELAVHLNWQDLMKVTK